MSNAISAELTQKPDSPYGEPQVGQVRRFELEDKGEFQKAKNTKNEDYGAVYTILAASRKKDWNSEQHGTFHQWTLSLEPSSQDGAGVGASSGQQGEVSAPATSAPSKKDDDIARAVAFKGAVELVAAKVGTGWGENIDLSATIKSFTNDLLPIVTGESGNAPAPTEKPDNGNAAQGADEDVPLTADNGTDVPF